MLAVVVTLGALIGVNAAIERKRTCGCPPECWCKTPLGRNFRWVLPIHHRAR